MKARIAVIVGVLFIPVALTGCNGLPEEATARAQNDCYALSSSAIEYEECLQLTLDWLRDPEENPMPSHVAETLEAQ